MSSHRELVIVLGHENSVDGSLSRDAIARVRKAVEHIQSISSKKSVLVVTTGGFGRHFNTSNVPHGKLLMQAIIESNVSDVEFLDHVHSCGTLEDALGILGLLRGIEQSVDEITIVTSSYHRPRAEYIFSRVMPFWEIFYLEDGNIGTRNQLEHESRSLDELNETMPQLGDLSADITESRQHLAEELRHYDNLSYFAILASFSVILLWATNMPTDFPVYTKLILTFFPIAISCAFFLIYLRLAGTAASARETLSAVCFLLKNPHLGSSRNTNAKYSPRIVTSLALALLIAWLMAAALVLVPPEAAPKGAAETADASGEPLPEHRQASQLGRLGLTGDVHDPVEMSP